MDLLIAAAAGFLVAVLWMDLMFDVLALSRRGPDPEMPEEALATVAGYYARVTTGAAPMGNLVGLVMFAMVLALLLQLWRGEPSRLVTAGSLALAAGPIVLALTRVFPNARRLGERRDSIAEQGRLARAILRDHVLCFGFLLTLLALRWSTTG